jgi:hypothetical protein
MEVKRTDSSSSVRIPCLSSRKNLYTNLVSESECYSASFFHRYEFWEPVGTVQHLWS